MKNSRFLSVIALSIITLTTTAAAIAAPPPAPNLDVLPWIGNSNPTVESPYQYTTRVKNIGNKTASSVVVTVEFPLTINSPTRYILGNLSGVSSTAGSCSTANNKITCSVGSIAKNKTVAVTFTFEFPVATTAPFLKTTATTTSQNEVNTANNQLMMSPSVTYPINTMTPGTYLVSSCTGQGLTSFLECEKAPGSIQNVLSLDFELGGTLSVTNYPGYTGLWDQYLIPDRSLHFDITGAIDFVGYASSSTCYKGITTFTNTSPYNSAYRVCRQ